MRSHAGNVPLPSPPDRAFPPVHNAAHFLRHITDLLCDYEIDLPSITARQKLRPCGGAFRVGGCRACINIETDKFLHRIQSQCRTKHFFVALKTIFVSGLIEVANVHGDLERNFGAWLFVPNGCQPFPMFRCRRRFEVFIQAYVCRKLWTFAFSIPVCTFPAVSRERRCIPNGTSCVGECHPMMPVSENSRRNIIEKNDLNTNRK